MKKENGNRLYWPAKAEGKQNVEEAAQAASYFRIYFLTYTVIRPATPLIRTAHPGGFSIFPAIHTFFLP